MAATVSTHRQRATGVGFDLQGALDILRDLRRIDNRLPWLQERAMQTLLRRLPVEARRDIQAEYNLPAARIRDNLRASLIGGSTARAAGVRLVGQWKRGIGLMNYSARATRKGVSYSVYRGRRQVAQGTFIARLLGGNDQVVERYGPKVAMTKGRYIGHKRQRVEVLYRSTVAQMLAQGRRPERLLDFSRDVLRSEMRRLLDSYDY